MKANGNNDLKYKKPVTGMEFHKEFCSEQCMQLQETVMFNITVKQYCLTALSLYDSLLLQH